MFRLFAQSGAGINGLIEQAKAEGWYAWLIVGAILVVVVLGFAAYKLSRMLDGR